MYDKMMEKLTPKCQLLIGAVLFIAGLIRQLVSSKSLDMYAFYIMSAALLCLSAVIIKKISKAESINFILYIVLNMAVLIVGFALTELESVEGVIMYSIWGLCVVADWVANGILVQCDGIAKRIVMGFVASIVNILLIAIVFWVPILMSVF